MGSTRSQTRDTGHASVGGHRRHNGYVDGGMATEGIREVERGEMESGRALLAGTARPASRRELAGSVSTGNAVRPTPSRQKQTPQYLTIAFSPRPKPNDYRCFVWSGGGGW